MSDKIILKKGQKYKLKNIEKNIDTPVEIVGIINNDHLKGFTSRILAKHTLILETLNDKEIEITLEYDVDVFVNLIDSSELKEV